jgi:Spy/CpxP family protein refolding chaperone
MFTLRGLDLTDDQRARIRAIHEEGREARQGPPADVQLRRELQAALYADTPDPAKIAGLQEQLLQAQAARQANQVAIEQKIAQVLTPEQRAQVRERLAGKPGR